MKKSAPLRCSAAWHEGFCVYEEGFRHVNEECHALRNESWHGHEKCHAFEKRVTVRAWKIPLPYPGCRFITFFPAILENSAVDRNLRLRKSTTPRISNTENQQYRKPTIPRINNTENQQYREKEAFARAEAMVITYGRHIKNICRRERNVCRTQQTGAGALCIRLCRCCRDRRRACGDRSRTCLCAAGSGYRFVHHVA